MLAEIIEKYLKLFPQDWDQLELLILQVEAGESLNDRRNFRGHVAGDAIILSPDLKKVLIVHHIRYQRWVQPGGHWDPDEDGPWVTAEREAIEEAAVKIARRVNLTDDERVPLQIITGPVWPNTERAEPHHWHHDFRYGFIAKSKKLGRIQDDGVGSAKWLPVDQFSVSGDHNPQESLRRLLQLLN